MMISYGKGLTRSAGSFLEPFIRRDTSETPRQLLVKAVLKMRPIFLRPEDGAKGADGMGS